MPRYVETISNMICIVPGIIVLRSIPIPQSISVRSQSVLPDMDGSDLPEGRRECEIYHVVVRSYAELYGRNFLQRS